MYNDSTGKNDKKQEERINIFHGKIQLQMRENLGWQSIFESKSNNAKRREIRVVMDPKSHTLR